MSAAAECPYHHPRWRSRTQQLLNALRGKLLSPAMIKRFPTAVCACPEKGCFVSPEILGSVPDLLQWLHSKPATVPTEAHSILEHYLNTASQKSEGQGAGLVGLVSVISEAASGNFNRLEPNPSLPRPQLAMETPPEEQWMLSLDPGHLGVLLGCKGRSIKPLCSEFGVYAYFGEKQKIRNRGCTRWRNYQSLEGTSVKVTVVGTGKGEKKPDLEGFKKKLTERGRAVQAKRSVHEAAMRGYNRSRREWLRVRRQQYLQRGAVRVRPSVGVHRNSKEAATDHFERKQQQKTKTRHPSRATPHAALEEGHCLNCQAPYSSNQMEDGACTFHSGFLTAVKVGKNRGYKWTCCGRRTAEQHATLDLHTRTGCSTGRHTWRAGRGAGRGTVRKTRDSRSHVPQTDIFVI